MKHLRRPATGRRLTGVGSAALALTLVLAGCAGVAEVTGTASQEDLVQIRADVAVLQATLQRARVDLEKRARDVDGHLQQQARDSQQRLDDLARRVDALSTTLTTLTGRVDELGGRLETLSRRLGSVPPGSPPPPRAPVGPPPSGGAVSPPAAGGIQPQDLYQTAYIDFSRGSYPLAVAGFREFLRRHPDHDLADNAQYWIGEAHVSLARAEARAGRTDRAAQELEKAIQEFRKVIANYPRGDKAPTALYKEALALIELKQAALAQSRLQYLIDNFPQAAETPLARERLAALRGD